MVWQKHKNKQIWSVGVGKQLLFGNEIGDRINKEKIATVSEKITEL